MDIKRIKFGNKTVDKWIKMDIIKLFHIFFVDKMLIFINSKK